MTPDQLKSIQAPFKAKYRADPACAQLESSVVGELLQDHPAVKVQTTFGPFIAGLHPAAGGDGSEKCSVDLLLEALVSCAGVTFNAVATAMGIGFESVTVTAQSAADMRGTLGIAKDVPVGLTQIELKFDVKSSASNEQLETLLRQTERYCVVYQTLLAPPPVKAVLTRS